MDLTKIMDKLGSKRALLGAYVIYYLREMSLSDPENAVYYAGGMVAIVLGFMVSEHIEKGRTK